MAIIPATGTFQSFCFESVDVRIVDIDGNPWFVATDILAAMKSTRPVTTAVQMIEEDLGEGFTNSKPLKTSGGVQDVVILHEAAVTLLISRSRTPMGKAFNRHLHSVILPTIRKTGKFVAHPECDADLFEATKRELKAARIELMQAQILAARAKASRLNVRFLPKPVKPIEFSPSIKAWVNDCLKPDPDSLIYIGTGNKEGTLSYAYQEYCALNGFEPLHFQRFSVELLSYARHGKRWEIRKANHDRIGTPLIGLSFI